MTSISQQELLAAREPNSRLTTHDLAVFCILLHSKFYILSPFSKFPYSSNPTSSMLKRKIIIAFFIGLVLLFICMILSGGGHGSIQPLLFFFPFAFIQLYIENDILSSILMLLQFPIYTALYYQGKTIKARLIIGFLLITAHVIGSYYLLIKLGAI